MRDPALQSLLTAAETALSRITTGPAAAVAADVMRRWSTLNPVGASADPAQLPVCDWIAPALAARDDALARAFAAVAPRLHWARRASADPADTAFWAGHANAMILGPGGAEPRADVWLGATVMAPGTEYPPHSHPPAEIYLPLSPGTWWNAGMDWTDPGVDGHIYNSPGILHAMRAGPAPFLALWALPI